MATRTLKAVKLGADLVIEVPCDLFTPRLNSGDRYTVVFVDDTSGPTLLVEFKSHGDRMLGLFGMFASGDGPAANSTSTFGVNIESEELKMSLKAGDKVLVDVNSDARAFSACKP